MTVSEPDPAAEYVFIELQKNGVSRWRTEGDHVVHLAPSSVQKLGLVDQMRIAIAAEAAEKVSEGVTEATRALMEAEGTIEPSETPEEPSLEMLSGGDGAWRWFKVEDTWYFDNKIEVTTARKQGHLKPRFREVNLPAAVLDAFVQAHR